MQKVEWQNSNKKRWLSILKPGQQSFRYTEGDVRNKEAHARQELLFLFSPFVSLANPTLSNSFARVQRATMDNFTTRLLWNMWAEIWLEETSLCF